METAAADARMTLLLLLLLRLLLSQYQIFINAGYHRRYGGANFRRGFHSTASGVIISSIAAPFPAAAVSRLQFRRSEFQLLLFLSLFLAVFTVLITVIVGLLLALHAAQGRRAVGWLHARYVFEPRR